MMVRRLIVPALLLVAACAMLAPSTAWGQAAGVCISPDGVLSVRMVADPGGRLHRELTAAARADLDPDLLKPSKLRKVSLNRLEAAIADRAARGLPPEADMLHMAGLLSVEYVFYLPETKDIILAGPAEGYVRNEAGRAVGLTSGRSVIELEDVVAALRAFPPTGDPTAVISVSIDPTQEGLSRLQRYLSSVAGRVRPGDANVLVAGMQNALGLQNVTIRGVSPATHFAQVLVEADYRMKLIGIGLEKPAVNIASYISNARSGDVAANALQRWFFTPEYDCVRVSDDRMAMQLVGQGVKLTGEDQVVRADGVRVVSKRVDKASDTFCTSFTAHYEELAQREPVYAQMRNLINLSVAAAYIQKQDFYGHAGWTMPMLGDERAFPIETHTAPTQVATAVNAVWKGRTLMTPIGGGVNIQATQALQPGHLLSDTNGEVAKTRSAVDVSELAAGQWWWD
ncbi:DUF1598 domain-containing protein [Lignipirellula cremea]|uniref:DUF1598 domain-containing protein n=1 Tax=Lignipirellula cremea TaxID=2528010 RepID=A0A518E1K6_9BACT|nr:DUF1598 domain-containing protein [Lignipirellula cremea]QDU97954.1 hypothetical protein Pla8534_58130 [Lignipirellula cremea]